MFDLWAICVLKSCHSYQWEKKAQSEHRITRFFLCVDSVKCNFSQTEFWRHYCNNLSAHSTILPYFLGILGLKTLKVALSCTEGEDKAIQNCITTKKKPAGERLLIVSPFQRPEAVKGLFVQGPAQWRTQALVHEKLQCTKQLGLKGKATWCYKLLLYVLLSLSPCMPHSLTSLPHFPSLFLSG